MCVENEISYFVDMIIDDNLDLCRSLSFARAHAYRVELIQSRYNIISEIVIIELSVLTRSWSHQVTSSSMTSDE